MSIIENAIQHKESMPRKEIHVPEWGVTLYAQPFTLADKRKIYRMAGDDDTKILAYAIINKAELENGEKAFDVKDITALMTKTDSNVISRVATEMMKEESVDDMEKS